MKIQILLILFYCVYYVLGESSFIPKGQRAEIFELTDNEVPVFRITLPDEEFIALKTKADIINSSTEEVIEILNQVIIKIVEVINRQDFNKVFPGYDFKEILPELPIDENGHPTINYEYYLVNINNISEMNLNSELEFFQSVFSNSSLNLINVLKTLYNLDISTEADDELFMSILHTLGNISESIIENENENENENLNENINENENENQYQNQEIYDYFGYYYNYDVSSFEWNFDVPSSAWNLDAPSSAWNLDAPSSAWDLDAPSYAWDSEMPSSVWDSEMPSSAWDNEEKTPSLLDIILNYFQWKGNENNDTNSPSEAINDDNAYYPTPATNENDANSPTQTINENDANSTTGATDYYKHIFFSNFSTNDFYEYFKNYDFDKNNEFEKELVNNEYEFKTKNATMIVEINNEKKAFKKITFSLGGNYSRYFSKPGYNIKIRGGDELYGRRQFKLRGDASEPSYMRTKLVSDIRNRIGMPSLSANYATLYINDEYFGLFILTDVYKESWIEYVYGEKDTQQLYKCEKCDLTYDMRHGYKNENKEATNKKELYEFLAAMTTAKTASDVESIFDLDQYYKEIAVNLLTSSWDHFYHNFCVYKNKDKWIYLTHDYDLDMGMTEGSGPSYRINNFYSSITKKLIFDDDHRFREILEEIVANVFNPATLFPHIDEIKSFIRPYVKLDKTPDENGNLPGRINTLAPDNYTFEQWEDSTEFKNISISEYALKKFILLKYRIICKDYDLECDPVYLDLHYGQSLNANSTITENDESNVDVTVDDNKNELINIEDLENNEIIDTTEVADNEEYEINDDEYDMEDEASESSSSDDEEEETTSNDTISF